MKVNFKKSFAAIAATVMCAVPMANSLSASAADRFIIPEKSIKYDLNKADLRKIDTAAVKLQYGTLDIDTRIPIDPDNPTIPELPKIRLFYERVPDIRDLRKPSVPDVQFYILQATQVVEEVARYSYYDSNNKLVTIVIGYTTDGRYIIEYWTNFRKVNGVWKGRLVSRTQLNDPAYNTSLVSRVTKTEYYLDYSYRLRKEITGWTKGGNRIVENWRFSDVTGKWELMSRKITKLVLVAYAEDASVLLEKYRVSE
jgi:hypothetical protein